MSAAQAKLDAALPGAKVELTTVPRDFWPADIPPTEKFRVVRAGKVLGLGASEGEAVDRALFLWGPQR